MEFRETINATREKVWEILWGDTTYGEWTAVFAPGSKAVTDWNKGSKVLFVDGTNDGMLSMIADIKPHKFMSFRHLGVIKNGVEDTESAGSREWAGATENYTLEDVHGGTELIVELEAENANQHMLSYFVSTFPKALGKVKELAERS